MLLDMIAATEEVMTTRTTFGLFFLMDLRTPRVPFTAGTKSSCGSSASKWNGEAMCKTASTFLTASSNALSFLVSLDSSPWEKTYLSDVLYNDIAKVALALEEIFEVFSLIGAADRSDHLVPMLQQGLDGVGRDKA